jgi:Txe/YoeB family toxin of toxin-antitoxin system
VRGRTRLVNAGWRLVYTPQAQRDARKLARAGLRPQAERLVATLARDPFEAPPRFEKLVGQLSGVFSSRINFHHRLVYQVLEEEKMVKVLRLFIHYE